jgi:hypothetical protein
MVEAMKKNLIRIGIVVVLLVIVAVVVAAFMLGSIVKKGVETFGPKIAKVDMKLDSARIYPLLGRGTLNGLLVGNPEGCKTPFAIKASSISVAVQPRSLLADKVVVRSVKLKAPEIYLEGGLKNNNLTKIMDNVQAFAGGEQAAAKKDDKTAPPGKKLQVDEFVITDGKVHLSVGLLAGKTITVPLPNIELKDLGQGPEGITPAELTKKVTGAVLQNATQAATEGLKQIGKGVTDAAKGAGEQLNKAVKGVGGLFK